MAKHLCAEVGGDPEQASAAREALELCTYQVSQQLVKAIHKVAVVAGPEAFASWPAYAAAFTARGGVIEACASGSTACLPVDCHRRCGCDVVGPAVLYVLCRAVLCCPVSDWGVYGMLCCAVLCFTAL